MNEVSVALQMSGNRSLILLDELGQGTSMEDGLSIGWAIVEGFVLAKAFVLVATHLLLLTRISELYPQVTNYYMESSLNDSKKISLTHQLREGVNTVKNYGLSLAASTPIPKSVLQNAYQMAAIMEDKSRSKEVGTTSAIPNDNAVYIFAHRLLGFAASVPTFAQEHLSPSTSKPEKDEPHSTPKEEDQKLKSILKEMLQEFLTQHNQQY